MVTYKQLFSARRSRIPRRGHLVWGSGALSRRLIERIEKRVSRDRTGGRIVKWGMRWRREVVGGSCAVTEWIIRRKIEG